MMHCYFAHCNMTKIRKLQAEVLLLTGSKPKEVKGWFPDSIRTVPGPVPTTTIICTRDYSFARLRMRFASAVGRLRWLARRPPSRAYARAQLS